VAGEVTYTMARADCPQPGETNLPTFEDLDNNLAYVGPSGTLVDVSGLRYHLGHSDVVWQTEEVIKIQRGQSLLFSPSWYHRVIPQTYDATHTSVTLVVKYRKDAVNVSSNKRRVPSAESFILKPEEIKANTTKKLACYNVLDVIEALLDPTLDESNGIKILPCEKAHAITDFAKLLKGGNKRFEL